MPINITHVNMNLLTSSIQAKLFLKKFLLTTLVNRRIKRTENPVTHRKNKIRYSLSAPFLYADRY